MKKFRESVKKPGFLDNTFAILYFQRVGILLSRITQAMLAMTGHVTMLGISRSTVLVEVIGLYIFLYMPLPWATLLWVFFRKYLWYPGETYLLAGDEVVVTKSGKKTYGVDRFFSSISGKSVSGLSFFALSLVSAEKYIALDRDF